MTRVMSVSIPLVNSTCPSGGPGIFDPCERKPTDATQYMTAQDREDLTAASQVVNCVSSCYVLYYILCTVSDVPHIIYLHMYVCILTIAVCVHM